MNQQGHQQLQRRRHRLELAIGKLSLLNPAQVLQRGYAMTERQGRLIDKDEAGSMEKKKREGYF